MKILVQPDQLILRRFTLLIVEFFDKPNKLVIYFNNKMSKPSSLSIREIETQFHEEFKKSIPNPEESTPEEIEKTAQK
jgi:hypothetical protein